MNTNDKTRTKLKDKTIELLKRGFIKHSQEKLVEHLDNIKSNNNKRNEATYINFKKFISYLKLEEMKQDLEELKVDTEKISKIALKIKSNTLNKLKPLENFTNEELANYALGSKYRKSNSIKTFGDTELALATVYILEVIENVDIERFNSFSEITKKDADKIIPILLEHYDPDYNLTNEEILDTKQGGSNRTKGEFKPVYENNARAKHTYFSGRRPTAPTAPTPFVMIPTPQQQPVVSVQEEKKIVIEEETITITNDNLADLEIDYSEGLDGAIEEAEATYEDDGMGFADSYTPVATDDEEALLDGYEEDDFSDIAFKKDKPKTKP